MQVGSRAERRKAKKTTGLGPWLSHPPCDSAGMSKHKTGKTKPKTTGIVLPSLRAVSPLRVFIRDRSGAMASHFETAQRDLHARHSMTANFSDQGMTGSAKAFRLEVQAMRGPFSVALAGPKEGFSGQWSEIAGRRSG